MIPEFLPQGPALVIENDIRVLVAADCHFGAETELARHGLHIKSSSEERLKRLLSCIDESDCDMLLLLGDVKHSVPVTTRQEYFEMPRIIKKIRERIPFKVMPGNHDVGIERFLNEDELLPKTGYVIDGTGYIHGHTYPSGDLLGRLIVAGHAHPVVCLYDEVGCSLRSQPAYLLSSIDEAVFDGKNYAQKNNDGKKPGKKKSGGDNTDDKNKNLSSSTRALFVPAFFELAGGMDVRELFKSGLGPLFKAIDEESAEVFLSDGTYINSLGGLLSDECDRTS